MSHHVWKLLICATVLAACRRSPYPGFTALGDDVHLKMHILGEGERTADGTDSARLRVRIAYVNEAPGSIYSTEQVYGVQGLRWGGMVPVFERAHEGDSMSLILPAAEVPWERLGMSMGDRPGDTAIVRLELSLLALYGPGMRPVEALDARRADPDGFERRSMEAFLERDQRTWTRWGTSEVRYRIEGEASDPRPVRKGQLVTVTYTGARMEDGVVVDDTDQQGGPFTWRFGDPDQVMPGLELAVSLLHVGEQGEFLLPSAFAFGARGVQGVLEPHTPMHYTVRLIAVDRVTEALP